MVSVLIPTPLRNLTQNIDTVELEATTIGGVVEGLEVKFPGIKERLLDANGNLRRFIIVSLNGEDVRFLQDKETPLKDGDEVSITAAVAGG
jgi:molybdopterin synthase sulfur carrier subunit